jgi:hypothetical protein
MWRVLISCIHQIGRNPTHHSLNEGFSQQSTKLPKFLMFVRYVLDPSCRGVLKGS